ncbi:MAG: phosphoglycerate kinase [Alphaproteobacteria bacterium]
MAGYNTLDTLDVTGKRVLVRLDLNVPMKDGAITDTTRLDRVLPTIKELVGNGAKVIALSHFGRPKGQPNPDMSLAPVATALGELLGQPVGFAADCIGETAATAVNAMNDGDVLVLENTRFHAGEETNDPEFAKALAANGDLYVNDAFSAAHRAHGSTEGIARTLPSVAGRAMQKELEALDAALGNPERPVVAVVGGAKVSSKIELLKNLVGKVDHLLIGGAMANTFLAARGMPVGKSLHEPDLKGLALEILNEAGTKGCEIVLPVDGVVAKELAPNTKSMTLAADQTPDDGMILDAGTSSVAEFGIRFEGAKTVVWNGPLGAFETPPFDTATTITLRHVGMLAKAGRLKAIAGGGDTVAAINHAGNVYENFTYVSTAGGAFLEWLEGKTLPGVAALEK